MQDKEKKARIARVVESSDAIAGTIIGTKHGHRLLISLPWDPNGTKSASGKTQVHASTRGNKPLTLSLSDDKGTFEANAGVNVYTKP